MITIKQATEEDSPIIEDILFDAINWLDSTGKQMWTKERVSWEFMSTRLGVTANDFYIAYINNNPVGCMTLTDYDPHTWTDIKKGESFFIHRLAVKRIAAKQGVSKALINYAKTQAVQSCINAVRLDCWQNREKLREIYEREGFICVEEKILFEYYHAALYIWQNKDVICEK